MELNGVLLSIIILAVGAMSLLIGRFASLRRKTFYSAVGVCEGYTQEGKKYRHKFRCRKKGLEFTVTTYGEKEKLQVNKKYNLLVNPATNKDAILESSYKSMNWMDRLGIILIFIATIILIFAVALGW